MKILVLGCGRVGGMLASLFSRDGHDVTIVDRDVDSFRRLTPDFRGRKVVGNVIDDDALIRAGIEKADIVAAVTNGDNTNIMAAQIAQVKFNVPHVLARINDPLRAQTYHDFGLNTICHTTIIARMMEEALLQGKEGDLLCTL